MDTDTNIYTVVRKCMSFQHRSASVALDYVPDTATVERMVGSLRAAGFGSTIPASEINSVSTLVSSIMDKFGTDSRVRSASTTLSSPEDSNETFMNIEALIDKGSCPRCKTAMSPVKLSSKKNANFCPDCRTCVWTRDK